MSRKTLLWLAIILTSIILGVLIYYLINQGDQPPSNSTSLGTMGDRPGQLRSPFGVAVDESGNIYVADTVNNRIQKFDHTMKLLKMWGERGSDVGMLDAPTRLILDNEGNVYVTDNGNNRIQKFTSDGSFIAEIGSLGQDTGYLAQPTGLCLDKKGNILTTST